MTKPWFVCQSNVREERRASFYLKEKGFEVYLPIMEAQRLVGQRQTLVQRPLFPGYLFVRFNEQQDIERVRWTRGVHKILPESIRPLPVDDRAVECIRGLGQRDGVIRKQPFRVEDRVRILRGPFKDLVGIFEEWTSDKGRVRILLRFVGYHTSVELHHSLLEKVA